MLKTLAGARAIFTALLTSLVGVPAGAATLSLHSSWRSLDGAAVTQWDGAGTINLTPAPGSYDYGHTIGAAVAPAVVPGSVDPVFNPSGSEFYDDFVFTVSDAVANSVTTTISLNSILGIANMQARLYAFPGTMPNVASPAPGQLAQVWASAFVCGAGCGGEQVVLPDIALAAGTYVLELRGIVSGTVSGSYGGALNLAPPAVPLPGAVWFLGSALGGLALVRRQALR